MLIQAALMIFGYYAIFFSRPDKFVLRFTFGDSELYYFSNHNCVPGNLYLHCQVLCLRVFDGNVDTDYNDV